MQKYMEWSSCVCMILVDYVFVCLVWSIDVEPNLLVVDLHVKYAVQVVHLRTCIVWYVIV